MELSTRKYCFSSFPGANDVWFSLRNATYQNNSCVTLEDIGEGDDALFCKTNLSVCCGHNTTRCAKGDWFFPDGSEVLGSAIEHDFYRNRSQMVVKLNRRRGGEEGTYRCEIPESMNVTQTIYIGVYSTSTSTSE